VVTPISQPRSVTPIASAKKPYQIRIIGIAILILILAVVIASFAFQIAQRAAIANVQVESVALSNIGVHFSGVSMNVDMVVYNPNSITAILDEVSYSVYANGTYVESGQTSTTYDIPPQSEYTLTFPLSMGGGSAFSTIGNYILNGGHVSWEIKGTGNIVIN
jgi:LEA14-like dessication related protein